MVTTIKHTLHIGDQWLASIDFHSNWIEKQRLEILSLAIAPEALLGAIDTLARAEISRNSDIDAWDVGTLQPLETTWENLKHEQWISNKQHCADAVNKLRHDYADLAALSNELVELLEHVLRFYKNATNLQTCVENLITTEINKDWSDWRKIDVKGQKRELHVS